MTQDMDSGTFKVECGFYFAGVFLRSMRNTNENFASGLHE